MTLFLISVSVALVVSFFCSLAEAVVLSLTPGELADLSQKHPRIGKIWNSFKTNIQRPVAVILILNTAALTIGSTVAGAQVEQIWPKHGILIFSITFTTAILFFTEILPKTLGVEYRRTLSLVIAPSLNFL